MKYSSLILQNTHIECHKLLGKKKRSVGSRDYCQMDHVDKLANLLCKFFKGLSMKTSLGIKLSVFFFANQ